MSMRSAAAVVILWTAVTVSTLTAYSNGITRAIDMKRNLSYLGKT
jgi:hypothetical protein